MILKLSLQTLKLKRLLFGLYSTIGAGFLLLYMFVYPTVQEQSANYEKIISTMPKGVVAAFNISQTKPTLMGFLSAKHFSFVWALMLILLLTTYGGFAIAKEVENKTMGLLLSQPISRSSIYISRCLTGLLGIGIFVASSELITWPLAALFHYSISLVDLSNVGVLGVAFGIAILGLSLLFSAFASETSRVTAGMSGLLLVMYVCYLIASLEPRVDWFRYGSIFHYFNPGEVVGNGALNIVHIALLCSLGLLTGAIGYLRFNNRDI